MAAPGGARLKQYEDKRGRPYWKATLPKGVTFGGQNAMARGFGEGFRSEAAATAAVWAWLMQAKEAGVLP